MLQLAGQILYPQTQSLKAGDDFTIQRSVNTRNVSRTVSHFQNGHNLHEYLHSS